MRGSRKLLWALLLLGVSGFGCQAHTPDAPAESSPDATQSALDTAPLPDSFKGYELYAWGQSSALSFVLITGTNRQKTVAEITEAGDDVTSDDWVRVRGEGLDELKALLARVPEQTSVVLSDLEGLPPLSNGTREELMRALAKP